MPFGTFRVYRREAKPVIVKEKETKEPLKPKAPDPLRPEPEPDWPESKVVVDYPAGPYAPCRILLAGRNLMELREFLCSMERNMGDVTGEEGLSFYTRELAVMNEVLSRKKKLDMFFWNFSDGDWTFPEEEPASKTYTFTLGPSGDQARAMDLVFRCVTPEAAEGWTGCDAVWILADAAALEKEDDPYAKWVREALPRFTAGQEGWPKTVCFLPGQFEHMGCFEGGGKLRLLPDKLGKKLSSLCKERLIGGGEPLPRLPAAVIPVQIYGGLAYKGTDERGNPVLHISDSGASQSYIPACCETPLLYTLQVVAGARQAELFADAPCGGLMKVLYRHYGNIFGNPVWKPELLKGGDKA